MNHFEYRNGEMFAEQVPLKRIAQEVGTPAYVYSLATLKRHFKVFDQAFAKARHIVCFSVKANSNLALLRAFAKEGSGFDIVSGGELFRALKVGADPKKIVFSGVGKKKEEIEYALEAGILMFNVESEEELFALNEIAAGIGKKAPISLRVNPDVDPQTHPYISTGMTHTRLFTFSSLRQLLEQRGFQISKSRGIPAPFPVALGNNPLSRFLVAANKLCLRLFPSWFSYQMLVVAAPRPSLELLLQRAIDESSARAEKVGSMVG